MAWLARNYDNKLFIHEELPRKYMGNYISKGISFRVKNVEFNTVTYENSPVHISKFDKVVEDTSTYDYVYVLAIIGGSSDRGVMGIHDNINNMLKCTNGGKPTQVKNEDYYYDLGILHEDKTVKLLYNDDIVWVCKRVDRKYMNDTYFFFIDTECGLDYAKFITCPNIKDIKNFLRKHRLKFPANIINKFKSKDMPYREFIEGGGDDFVEIYFEKFGK